MYLHAPADALAATQVDLGSADSFAILAGSTITNTGSSVISGDLGLSPGTSVTGFPPGVLNGTEYIADTTAEEAKTDLISAYTDAAGQTPVTTIPTELGGTTLTAGIYTAESGTFGLTGTLTLDAEGDADAVFIFQTATTLISAASSSVVLTNGAQACNVFWVVGSSATLGTDSALKGNILALTSATLTTGSNVEGRVLARNGAVTLDTAVVTKAICLVPPEVPTSPDVPGVAPLINVTKVPSPLALPDGAGSVTYDYTVTNVGTIAMSDVTVTDDKCSAVEFVSGDSDDDSLLDTTETWAYACTKTVSRTVTNTVTATGEANGFIATDSASATVVVGEDVAPPLINLVKVPDQLIILPGDVVTYTYTVTNPGTEPLTDVSVVDDECDPVTFSSGDTNQNEILGVSETWIFTCQTSLTETTTNTGTAEGSANGLTAIDYSLATVVVPITPTVPTAPTTPVSTAAPLINVTKVPTPLTLPDGPGSVTYDYAVTNAGTVAMSNISISDDTCDTVEFVSGDSNGDSQLDVDEIWSYGCTSDVSGTVTNVVTVTGEANGSTAIDTATATVVVGEDVVPPLLNLVKIPDTFLLSSDGGLVTYTYTVTNPGTEPLTDVSVVDDNCSPVTYSSGDVNDNQVLNLSETWIFTCQSNLTETTTNIGSVKGSANGLTAIDFSIVTVVVSPVTTTGSVSTEEVTTTPSFPSTGMGPGQTNGSWKVVGVGVLVAVFSLLYVARKKQLM